MNETIEIDISKNVQEDLDKTNCSFKLTNKNYAQNLNVQQNAEHADVDPQFQFQHTNESDSIRVNTMGKKDDKNHRSEKGLSDNFIENATNVSHVCVTIYMCVVIYLCFNEEFVFFTWHPLLLSIGWLFLMTEGILSLSKYNVIPRNFSRTWKLRFHWIGLGIGAALITIGFIIAVVTKNKLNKYHFQSWHSIFGLGGFIFCLPSCVNGTAALYSTSLYPQYISPKLNKLIHVACGTLSFILGGISLILSVYTKWFGRHTEHSSLIFYLCLLLVTIGLSLAAIRPLQATYNKTIKFIKLCFPSK